MVRDAATEAVAAAESRDNVDAVRGEKRRRGGGREDWTRRTAGAAAGVDADAPPESCSTIARSERLSSSCSARRASQRDSNEADVAEAAPAAGAGAPEPEAEAEGAGGRVEEKEPLLLAAASSDADADAVGADEEEGEADVFGIENALVLVLVPTLMPVLVVRLNTGTRLQRRVCTQNSSTTSAMSAAHRSECPPMRYARSCNYECEQSSVISTLSTYEIT